MTEKIDWIDLELPEHIKQFMVYMGTEEERRQWMYEASRVPSKYLGQDNGK